MQIVTFLSPYSCCKAETWIYKRCFCTSYAASPFHKHTLHKTVKCNFMPLLEKDVTCPSSLLHSQVPTACLIDAMALIQMLKSAGTATFGELAQVH